MSTITIGSKELSLVKQNNQRRYVKLQVINKDRRSVGIINGRLISCNVSIDGTSDIQRTANITIETELDYMNTLSANISVDAQRDLPANYYIKVWGGIEDNNTMEVSWYSQGVFIIAESGYNFDPTTRTLSLSLIDLMNDLNGTRGGQLHAYTSIVKNEQRIDKVIEEVLQLCNVTDYSIEPITVLRDTENPFDENETEEDYMVPYDMDFSVGLTAYDILSKMVGLYPYYEMGFDENGMFFVRKELLEQNDSLAVIDAVSLEDLVLTEDTSIDWNYIKNYIEVWGKDGLYYGEAKDEVAGSPFNVNMSPVRRLVVTGSEYGIDTNAICDRYIDAEKAKDLELEQAELEAKVARLSAIQNPTIEEQRQLAGAKEDLSYNKAKQKMNVGVKGDDLAKQWAERILYDRTRLQDNVTIKTVLMPFFNDTGFKMSYRTQVDKKVRNYVVKSISHDFASGTSTFNMVRFYDDCCISYWTQLGQPVITNAQCNNGILTVSINSVQYAQTYMLYANGVQIGSYTGTTLVYDFTHSDEGEYTINVVAQAPYYRPSPRSADVMIIVNANDMLLTDTNDILVTDDDDIIILDEEESNNG